MVYEINFALQWFFHCNGLLINFFVFLCSYDGNKFCANLETCLAHLKKHDKNTRKNRFNIYCNWTSWQALLPPLSNKGEPGKFETNCKKGGRLEHFTLIKGGAEGFFFFFFFVFSLGEHVGLETIAGGGYTLLSAMGISVIKRVWI